MKKIGQIKEPGLLDNYTNYEELIKSQASQPAYKDEVKRQKVVSTQKLDGVSKLGGVSRGYGIRLKQPSPRNY